MNFILKARNDAVVLAILCVSLTLAAVFFRPALPVDETRYLSVAWEMFLNHNYFLPTMNFQPYHHKPPLLFWLINLFWSVFGVHRWSAVLTVSAVSAGCVFCLSHLARILFPRQVAMNKRLPWIMVGAAPFLIYGTIVMFDFTLTLCVLLAWIFAAKFMTERKWFYAVPAGLAMGMGVLAKGPVVVLFTLLPLLFAPMWREDLTPRKNYYLGLLAMFLIALGPVLFWLVPVYLNTSAEFFEWLVLRQTTGRMTGNFGGAHVQPIYFYVPIFIALFVPWILFPLFWQRLKNADRSDAVLRFCFFAIVPALAVFTAMSGKQPHYLVPLTPFCAVLIAKFLEDVELARIKQVAIVMAVLFVAGQGVASVQLFPRYDYTPVARIIAENPDRDWAYVPNYHAELGFLARMEKMVHEPIDVPALAEWFVTHPGGMAVVRHKDAETLKPYKILYSMDFSSNKRVSVIELRPETPAP